MTYTATQFAKEALAQVGKPYVLGAEARLSDPNPPRFDCSELTEWLFGRSGNPLGDLAAAQYDKTAKASGSVRVGDLVFLRNNRARWNGIGHVAVIIGGSKGVKYTGGGQYATLGEPIIVEARGRASGVVRTTLSYWRTRKYYTGVRRLPGFRLAPPTAPSVETLRLRWLCSVTPSVRQDIGDGQGAIRHQWTAKRRDAVVELLTRGTLPDVIGLAEVTSSILLEIRKGLPGGTERWASLYGYGNAVLTDRERFTAARSRQLEEPFGDGRGAVIQTVRDRKTGHKYQVAAYHLPPDSVASKDRQAAMVRKLAYTLIGLPGRAFMLGDGMNDPVWAGPRYRDARQAADTSPNRGAYTWQGKGRPDHIGTVEPWRPVTCVRYEVLHPASKLLDHSAIEAVYEIHY